jgi:pimeloyl-ACP methyl ester carboxylesterase
MKIWFATILILFPFGLSKATIKDNHMLDVHGIKIWYSQSGKKNAIPTIYLHGGPGYNSYAFEHSIGPLLEKDLNMIYLDQRGGGRSQVEDSAVLGINYLRDDVEALRLKLGAKKVNLIAHSFGGLVALEYLKKYKAQVSRVVLVDISAGCNNFWPELFWLLNMSHTKAKIMPLRSYLDSIWTLLHVQLLDNYSKAAFNSGASPFIRRG